MVYMEMWCHLTWRLVLIDEAHDVGWCIGTHDVDKNGRKQMHGDEDRHMLSRGSV